MAALLSNEIVSFSTAFKSVDSKIMKCKNYDNYFISIDCKNTVVLRDMKLNVVLSHTIELPPENRISDVIFSEEIFLSYVAFYISTSMNLYYIYCFDIAELHTNMPPESHLELASNCEPKSTPCRIISISEKASVVSICPIPSFTRHTNNRDILVVVGQPDGIVYGLDSKINKCNQCERNGASCSAKNISAAGLSECEFANDEDYYSASSIHNKFVLYEHDVKLECTSLLLIQSINCLAIGFRNGDFLVYDYEHFKHLILFREKDEYLAIKQFLVFKLEDDPRACVFLIVIRSTPNQPLIPPTSTKHGRMNSRGISSTISIHQIWYRCDAVTNKNIFVSIFPRCKIVLKALGNIQTAPTSESTSDSTSEPVATTEEDLILLTEAAQVINDSNCDGFCSFTIFAVDAKTLERKCLYLLRFDYNIYLNNADENIINIYLQNGKIFSERPLAYLAAYEVAHEYLDALCFFVHSSLTPLSKFPYDVKVLSETTISSSCFNCIVLYSVSSSAIIQLLQTDCFSNNLHLLEMHAQTSIIKPTDQNVIAQITTKFKIETFIRNVFYLGHTKFLTSFLAKRGQHPFKQIIVATLHEILDEARDKIYDFSHSLFHSHLVSYDGEKELHFYIGALNKLSILVSNWQKDENRARFHPLEPLLKFGRILLFFYTIFSSDCANNPRDAMHELWPRKEYNDRYSAVKTMTLANSKSDELFIDKLICQLNQCVSQQSKANNSLPASDIFQYPPTSLQKALELIFLNSFLHQVEFPIIESLLVYVAMDLEQISNIYRTSNLSRQVAELLQIHTNWLNSIRTLWFLDNNNYSKAFEMIHSKMGDSANYIYFPNQQFIVMKRCFENITDSNLFYNAVLNYSQFHVFSDHTKLLLHYVIHFNQFDLLLAKTSRILSQRLLLFILDECIESQKLQNLLLAAKSKSIYHELYNYLIEFIPIHFPYGVLLDYLHANHKCNPINIQHVKQCSNKLLKNSALICAENMQVESLTEGPFEKFDEVNSNLLANSTYNINNETFIQRFRSPLPKLRNFSSASRINTSKLFSQEQVADEINETRFSLEGLSSLQQNLNHFQISFSNLEYFLMRSKPKFIPKKELSVSTNLDSPLRTSILKKRKYEANSEEIFANDTPKKIRFDAELHIDEAEKPRIPSNINNIGEDKAVGNKQYLDTLPLNQDLCFNSEVQDIIPAQSETLPVSNIVNLKTTPLAAFHRDQIKSNSSPISGLSESVNSKTIETFLSSSKHVANITSTQKSEVVEQDSNTMDPSLSCTPSSSQRDEDDSCTSNIHDSSNRVEEKKRGRGRPPSRKTKSRKVSSNKISAKELSPIYETTEDISNLESSVKTEATGSRINSFTASRIDLMENYLAGAHYYKLRPRKNRDGSFASSNSISQYHTPKSIKPTPSTTAEEAGKKRVNKPSSSVSTKMGRRSSVKRNK